MTTQFTDNAPISGTRMTSDGYLVADVLCARTGCQDYHASEIGLSEDRIVSVYRPESAVFSKDSMATFVGKPVTVGHPVDPVTADNWKDLAVGDIGEEIARDGESVRVSIKLMDARAIETVVDGTREISMGYTAGIKIEDGTAPDGTHYDAIQTGPIKINHLAIVDRARGGAKLRIGDVNNWGVSPLKPTSDTRRTDMSNDALKTVVLGDKAVKVSAEDAATLDAFKATSAADAEKVKAAHDAEIAAKDAELAKVQAQLDAAKEAELSDADIDKRVADRAALIATASAIVPDVKTSGLSDADIRKSVVVAKLGDEMGDKAAAYIDARFDILAEDAAKADPFADAMKNGDVTKKVVTMDQAYAERNKRMEDAWKQKKGA